MPSNFRLNGLRVPHRRAAAAPGRVDRAVGELDQIQRVLDVRIQLLERGQFAGIELAGHAAVQDRQRLRPDVFAELEEFEKAQPKRLEIVRARAGV